MTLAHADPEGDAARSQGRRLSAEAVADGVLRVVRPASRSFTRRCRRSSLTADDRRGGRPLDPDRAAGGARAHARRDELGAGRDAVHLRRGGPLVRQSTSPAAPASRSTTRSSTARRRSARRRRACSRRSRDGVFLVDRHGVIRTWNRAAAAATGLRLVDVVDRARGRGDSRAGRRSWAGSPWRPRA